MHLPWKAFINDQILEQHNIYKWHIENKGYLFDQDDYHEGILLHIFKMKEQILNIMFKNVSDFLIPVW